GRHHGSEDYAALLRWSFLHGGWKSAALRSRVGTLSGTAECGFSIHFEYRAHRRALAYPDEDKAGADSGAFVAQRMAGDESAGCSDALVEAARFCRCGVFSRAC